MTIKIPADPDPAMAFVGRLMANRELAEAVFKFCTIAQPIAKVGLEMRAFDSDNSTKAAVRLALVEKAIRGW